VAVATSLFDAPAGPVLPSAAEWVTGTLFGDVAAGLCVLAVAFVGLMLMSGRLAARDGLRVVIGCFVLLGAPLIAAGLRSTAEEATMARSAGQPAIETYSRPAPVSPPGSYP
jgi:type IV secretory pathway VirB2 component (pilin)